MAQVDDNVGYLPLVRKTNPEQPCNDKFQDLNPASHLWNESLAVHHLPVPLFYNMTIGLNVL